MSDVRKPPLIYALAAILFAECALLVIATVYLIIELLVATPASYASAFFLTLLTAIAAVWLGFIAVHTLRGSSWIRGAAITWQILQIAIGFAAFQGIFGTADVGWLLVIPSVIVIVLLFTKPVLKATTRPER
ncbi:hypothetical protein [Glaciihabitans sp. dw_435]|uniref:hypothetical protein n=1 Tax=Glaciihabitans sp. dw_435 TaxID=2720081 RepID=UPI001BD383E5|nr:hypothetical protein [Glaciihabitans sp. dw_435]